jgi:hypothetical protein
MGGANGNGERMNMTCAEFQKVLPYIIETGGNAEEEAHLRECPVCSDLVQDLRYIAEQAKLLVPMEDPAPKVWNGIRDGLEREGLVKKPARARGRLLGPQSTTPWIAALTAIALVIGGLALYRRGRASDASQPANALDNADDAQDQQVLDEVAQSRPDMKDVYESNLKQVNASIRDAKHVLQRDPQDADARSGLLRAYEQKAMVYSMATRSSQ